MTSQCQQPSEVCFVNARSVIKKQGYQDCNTKQYDLFCDYDRWLYNSKVVHNRQVNLHMMLSPVHMVNVSAVMMLSKQNVLLLLPVCILVM